MRVLPRRRGLSKAGSGADGLHLSVQMDAATKSVQTNNQKLAGVLKRVASQRNFCIDIILITVLLAVGGYIYSIVR
jgi:hypothetical protein